VSRRVRGVAALPVLGALGALLAWGFSGLPAFGDWHGFTGRLITHVATPERHTTNVVTAVVFDYRGFDTMGEEFILFAAVVGVVLLLRGRGADEEEVEPHDEVTSDALRFWSVLGAGGAVLVGLWLAAFGLVTPGGGFQGGVAIASGVVVVYLAGSYSSWLRLSHEEALDPLHGGGAAAFAIVGFAALIAGSPFLHNVLGPGRPGTLFSGGSMAVVNWAVAVEVAAANLLLYSEFLEQYLAPMIRKRKAE
jgi:multicomponent Na+:H+ antiporter subunit B